MAQHLVPCECGTSIAVRTQQAGESVRCECGATLTIPDLRSLREFPEVQLDAKDAKKPWTPVRGMVFGVGFGAFLIGISCLGLFGFKRSQLDLTRPDMELIRQSQASLDEITPTNAWTIWRDVERRVLYRSRAPLYQQNRARARWLHNLMMVSGTVTVGGLIAAICSTFFGRTR